jgi:hypothetical protein
MPTVWLYDVSCNPETEVADSNELENVGWYPEGDLPYDKMLPDCQLWVPHLLAGETVTAFMQTDNGNVTDATMFLVYPAEPVRL